MIEKFIKKDIFAFIILTVLTIVALKYGFSTIPSIVVQQGIIADQQRVIDLGEIQSSINTYFQSNGELPSSLNKLNSNTDYPDQPLEITDPLTKKAFGFHIIDSSAGIYQLCAIFYQKVVATDNSNDTSFFTNSAYNNYESQFSHPAGNYCFNENTQQAIPSENPYPSTNNPAPNIINTQISGLPTPTPPVPTLNGPQADTKRSEDVSSLINAIQKYTADNAGSVPQNLVGLPPNMPIVINWQNFVDLCNELVPKYLDSLPVDPILNNPNGITKCNGNWNTGYMVSLDSSKHMTIWAPFSQAGNESLTLDAPL